MPRTSLVTSLSAGALYRELLVQFCADFECTWHFASDGSVRCTPEDVHTQQEFWTRHASFIRNSCGFDAPLTMELPKDDSPARALLYYYAISFPVYTKTAQTLGRFIPARFGLEQR
jgi:hypothetical protein